MNVYGVTFGGYLAKILSFKTGNLLNNSKVHLLSEGTVKWSIVHDDHQIAHLPIMINFSVKTLLNGSFSCAKLFKWNMIPDIKVAIVDNKQLPTAEAGGSAECK